MTERLSPHFTVAEFEASETAARHGIDNRLPPELLAKARLTAGMLEAVRAHLSELAGRDVPVRINSGYRSPALNVMVGGRPNSDHMAAEAADIIAPAFGTPRAVAEALEHFRAGLGIGQIALEFPSRGGWVHLSIRQPLSAINQVITIDTDGVVPGLDRALA